MDRDEDDPFDTDTDGIFLSDTGSPAKITSRITAEFKGPCLEYLLFGAVAVGLIFPLIVTICGHITRD